MSVADQICGLCGQPGADQDAKWTRQGAYWPGERNPEGEFVHAKCEEHETARARDAIAEPDRASIAEQLKSA